MVIQKFIDSVAERIARSTAGFVNTKAGRMFLGLLLVGPLTFIPTVWEAWTADNIDAFRTLTWPLMTMVNISFFISVCHNGDWRLRVVSVIWIFMMFSVWLATFVR